MLYTGIVVFDCYLMVNKVEYNSHIRHFIEEGGMSDCIEGLAKVQGNDTNIG